MEQTWPRPIAGPVHPATRVADHGGVSELDPQEGGRVDAWIQAGDEEHLLAGHDCQPGVGAGGGEGAVALEERAKVGHECLR
jgi:hypothetical protein